MISIVLYGRNDSYGYNLHKRAAISFNTFGELLTDPDDEIIFVDYNTVDDLPTFPEAIRDTLTAKAKKLLRVIRVRGDVQREGNWGPRPQLNEPLARNIGIRRAKPENPWVLSTNTDMVFVPRKGQSLSEVAGALSKGYYALPRYEVPETLWETVDRFDPLAIIESFRKWGANYNLNETVFARPYLLYDGPGDFQLFSRETIFNIQGFDERMVYGWHVDSNLCKRMHLLFGQVNTLREAFEGYHCDHTRVTTPAHASNRIENDWNFFCESLETPFIPEQKNTWGCNGRIFEEVRVNTSSSRYVEALDAIYAEPMAAPEDVTYTDKTFNNHLYYNTVHAFPYISDSLASAQRTLRLAYLGNNDTLLQMLGKYWERVGFEQPILVHDPMGRPGGPVELGASFEVVRDLGRLAEAELFLVDNHCPPETATKDGQGLDVLKLSPETLRLSINRMHAVLKLALHDQLCVALGRPPRKFIAAGVQNTIFERMFNQVIGLIAVPFACHIRHGFVRQHTDIDGPLAIFEHLKTLAPADLAALHQSILDCGEPGSTAPELQKVYDRLQVPTADLGSSADPGYSDRAKQEKKRLLAGILLSAVTGNLEDAARIFTRFLSRDFGCETP